MRLPVSLFFCLFLNLPLYISSYVYLFLYSSFSLPLNLCLYIKSYNFPSFCLSDSLISPTVSCLFFFPFSCLFLYSSYSLLLNLPLFISPYMYTYCLHKFYTHFCLIFLLSVSHYASILFLNSSFYLSLNLSACNSPDVSICWLSL
jgi:hypothetical protein